MAKILRRIIFFVFLAVFLVGAPKIIFYALGYSYRPGAPKGIVQTGLIYLSSVPPGATVYVGGRRYHEPTPAIIRDLLPGSYSIRLALKDYQNWTQTVPVEAAKASVLGKILLHPKKPDWRVRIAERFESLTAISKTKYFLLGKSKEKRDIYVYDRKEKKSRPLLDEGSGAVPRITEIYTVTESTHVLLAAESQPMKKWAWMDLDKSNLGPLRWRDLFSSKPEKILWTEKSPRYLFSFEKGLLRRFDAEKDTLEPVADRLYGFGVDEHKLLLLMEENNLISTDFLDKNRKSVFKAAGLSQNIFDKKRFSEVFRLADDVFFFLSDQGRLTTNQSTFPIAESGVLGFDYDKKHRKAVVWTSDAIGTVEFFKDKKGITENASSRMRVTWILRQARKIKHAFWAHDGACILFQDQDKVLLLELETFGSPSIYELLETKGGTDIFYDEDLGELFYLDKKTAYLMSLEVVPKWKVLEVPFSILQEKEKEGKPAT